MGHHLAHERIGRGQGSHEPGDGGGIRAGSGGRDARPRVDVIVVLTGRLRGQRAASGTQEERGHRQHGGERPVMHLHGGSDPEGLVPARQVGGLDGGGQRRVAGSDGSHRNNLRTRRT